MIYQRLKFFAICCVVSIIPFTASAQQPVPATAKNALQFAEPAAKSWAADAALVLIGTGTEPGMFADGRADIWNFVFYSAANDSARNFFADATRVINQEPPAGSLPSLLAIGTNWLDTDAVARVTESRGGGHFRSVYQNVKVLAGLGFNVSQPPDTRPGEKIWVVAYAAFSDTSQAPIAVLRFELAAGSGAPIPLERVVKNDPPAGENIEFVNQRNDTLAVLNFTSGAPDSVAVEAFPGILPDTTQNDKAVHRFYNITAYSANPNFEATLTLHYTQQEFDASGLSDESALKLYRRKEGEDWQLVGGTADTISNSVTVTGVTEFSAWAFADPTDQPLKVDDQAGPRPEDFNLWQNYPNPFNPTTTIQYQLPKAERVTLKIYNVMGQEVQTLVDEVKQPGVYKINWDGKNSQGLAAGTGLYVLRMAAGHLVQSKKIVLLK
ncbi:MAG: FlgD immunoglobulin-like domain containing protein [bacterium]